MIDDHIKELTEKFSEMECDLEPTVYKALAPHIEGIYKESGKAFAEVERMKLNQEFINILMTNPRITVTKSSLSELRNMLEDRTVEHEEFNRWNVNFHVKASTQPVEAPIADIPVAPEPVVVQTEVDGLRDLMRDQARVNDAFRIAPGIVQDAAIVRTITSGDRRWLTTVYPARLVDRHFTVTPQRPNTSLARARDLLEVIQRGEQR